MDYSSQYDRTVQELESQSFEYDAYVIHNPVGSDLDFVKHMAEKVEAPPYDFRLFISWRDKPNVTDDHYAVADLILNRCKKCIAVISKNFHLSNDPEDQLGFAFCSSSAQKKKKILPILLDDAEVPSILRPLTPLKYAIPEVRSWFWDRLCNALGEPDRDET